MLQMMQNKVMIIKVLHHKMDPFIGHLLFSKEFTRLLVSMSSCLIVAFETVEHSIKWTKKTKNRDNVSFSYITCKLSEFSYTD